MKILIASPNAGLSQNFPTAVINSSYSYDTVGTGKECQLRLYKSDYTALILDVDIVNHSCFEVLKYVKLNHLTVKVVLYSETQDRLKDWELDDKTLSRMGVSKVFTTPKSIPSLFKYLDLFNFAPKWKDIKPEEPTIDERETKLLDTQCTRIKMSDFLGGNISIFNLYIKLGANRYVKILNRGEAFNEARLEKYRLEGIEYLYFQTKERANYINFMNEMGRKMSCSPTKQAAKSVFVCINSVTEQYLDEVFTTGIQPQIIHEGKTICDNIFNLIRNDNSLNEIIEEYKKINPESFSHIFLVAFFSTVVCKNLDWVGDKTRDAVAMASLLHDIGMMRLPAAIRDIEPKEMNSKQIEIYQQHPRMGNEMLQKSSMVTEQIRQIVFQHHELVSGNGFPYGLTGIKIYPPAKIVSLADHFATILKKGNHTPLEGLKIMLQDRDRMMDFDPYIIRSLIKGFIKR